MPYVNSMSRPQGRNAQSFDLDPDPMGPMGPMELKGIRPRQPSNYPIMVPHVHFFPPSDRNRFKLTPRAVIVEAGPLSHSQQAYRHK